MQLEYLTDCALGISMLFLYKDHTDKGYMYAYLFLKTSLTKICKAVRGAR